MQGARRGSHAFGNEPIPEPFFPVKTNRGTVPPVRLHLLLFERTPSLNRPAAEPVRVEQRLLHRVTRARYATPLQHASQQIMPLRSAAVAM
jgi:hypothetical protein